MSVIELTLIVPSLGQKKHLESLFRSLQKQQTRAAIEVLICLTGPEDVIQTLPPLPSHMQLRVIPCPQPGIGIARNMGIASASAPVLFFLDEDGYLASPTDLDFIITMAHTQPRTLWGGVYLNSVTSSVATRFYNFMCNAWLFRHHHKVILGGCCFFHKGNTNITFPPHLPTSGEEYLFCKKALDQGYQIHTMQHWGVFHAPDYRWKEVFYKAWVQGKSLPSRPSTYNSQWGVLGRDFIWKQKKWLAPLLFYYLISRFSRYMQPILRISQGPLDNPQPIGKMSGQ